MNNTKQTKRYYEYQILVDGDVRFYQLGEEDELIQDATEYKNAGAFKNLNDDQDDNVVEILQWNLDTNPASGAYGEYHPEYFEIYPIFGRDLEYSPLKYENLPKYIQKKLDIIRKAIA